MRTTHVMNVFTDNADMVCQAINELDETYKNFKLITIIREGHDNWIYYQLGEKFPDQDDHAQGEKHGE